MHNSHTANSSVNKETMLLAIGPQLPKSGIQTEYQPFGKAGLHLQTPSHPTRMLAKIKHSYCNMNTHCLPDFIRVHVTIQLHLSCSKSTEEILSDTYP